MHDQFLESAVGEIQNKGDYAYNSYPSLFGQRNSHAELNRLNIRGDYRYGFYPFPAPNGFGNTHKPRKVVGYTINKKTKNVLKVYKKTTGARVLSNGKSLGAKKFYKTKTDANKALKKL